MAFTEFELKRIEKLAQDFIEKKRPPVHIRNELDLGYRIKGNSVEFFEVRPLWNNPKKIIEEPVAKTTFVNTQKKWKIFWQRADCRWHRYEPGPEVNTFEEFLSIVDNDDYACFWG